jgi:3-oxoacyl-[acyl-carrier-protein] synthase I
LLRFIKEISRVSTTYIAKTQVLTAAGANSVTNFCSYRAGINTYQQANYHTLDHHQITLALIPDAALPPLADALEEAALSYRDERLLQMASGAMQSILAHYQGDPIPLILAGPENYPNVDNQLPVNFLRLLGAQAELPILYSASRILCTGRTGMLEAIRLAQHYLTSGNFEQVLVGGIDSCQHSDWLHHLERNGRLKSESPQDKGDTFVPGEGAAFLLLTNNPTLAMSDKGYRITLDPPGFGDEPGYIYSEQPYQGVGLDAAVKAALAPLSEHQLIDTVFSSINGEHYWAKEFGIAMTRSSKHLHQIKHEHPADCYGDIGAASGGALIAFAALHSLKHSTPTNCLVCTSSDSAYRAAICVSPERISA